MKTTSNPTYDIAIVGGGIAGLAAAAYLARGGRSVILFEKSDHIGGRAISQDHHGYRFNLGAHAVYEKTVGAEVLNELGIKYTAGEPRDVRAVREGKIYDLPAGPLSLLGTGLLGPGEKLEAGRSLFGLLNAKPTQLQGSTLSHWLDRHIRHPRVRALIESTARTVTYTNAPDMIDMGLVAEQIQVTTRGRIFYVDGGWQTLVDGLLAAALKAGATIERGVRVRAVEHDGNHVTSVRLDDASTVTARSVIIAAGPTDASRLVDDGRNNALAGWAAQAVPVRAAALDVALRSLPNPHATVALDMDAPRFMTAQSVYSKVAPEGGALIYTLKYLHPCDHKDTEANERELESWLDVTQPGWRDEVVERRFLPSMTISHWLVTAQGGGLAGRPGPEVPGISGLYVAGDWVGPRGLLFSASLWSARMASHDILHAR
ncbi:MAG: FAD-dependent oxidoreductase [Chloroflexia bacterium]